MIKKTANISAQKSQIDWAAIQKRIIVMKYLPGYFQPATPPLTGWILDTGLWNDTNIWVDAALWID